MNAESNISGLPRPSEIFEWFGGGDVWEPVGQKDK